MRPDHRARAGSADRAGKDRSEALAGLSRELRDRFRAWGREPAPWPEELFGHLALRAFTLQFDAVPAYRAYCRSRGADPGSVSDWREIPPVPTAAFREVDLAVDPPHTSDLSFLTSGTSRGVGARGLHRVTDPALYRAALRPGFARFVLGRSPDQAAAAPAVRVGSLVTPFEVTKDSSLAWMCEDILGAFGVQGSRLLARAGGIDPEAARRFAEACASEGTSACLLTTTLALDAWLDCLEAEDVSIRLPPGSVVMDTGGAKGRRGLRRVDVARRAEERLGLPAESLVNEFGMTELLSQRYGRGAWTSGEGADGDAPPPLAGPPWLRTRALDPVSLEALPEGEVGVLCHVDLANAGSAVAVLTEDLGRVRGGVLEWLGRSPGAPPRGCSLATAELLEARRAAAGEEGS